MFESGTSIWHCTTRDQQFAQFFKQEEELLYCHDIGSVMNEFRIEYKKENWRIFEYLSKTSLKGVLLHNGKFYALMSNAHSIHVKEIYEILSTILQNINYTADDWILCEDLKVAFMLFVQQKGFKK